MPRTYYGPFSARNETYANAGNANLGRYPLGHYLLTPDGREYRFTLNDGTAEVAGNLYQSVATVGNHSNVAADAARAIGAVAVSATLGATAAAIDIYAEGTVSVTDATGEGYSYRIKRATSAGAAHAAADSSGVLTVNLDADESVQVALVAATSEVSFSRHRNHAALIHASPPTAALVGVSPGVAAASRFYWSQVKGLAAVLGDGTLLDGLPVQASIAVNGAVESAKRRARSGGTTVIGVVPTVMSYLRLLDQDGTTTDFLVPATVTTAVTASYDITGPIAVNAPLVGTCRNARADTEYSIIELSIN